MHHGLRNTHVWLWKFWIPIGVFSCRGCSLRVNVRVAGLWLRVDLWDENEPSSGLTYMQIIC